jgi:hypothetical protein
MSDLLPDSQPSIFLPELPSGFFFSGEKVQVETDLVTNQQTKTRHEREREREMMTGRQCSWY